MTMAGRPGILQLLQAEIELANAEGRTLDLERYAESLRGLGFQGHTVEYEAVGA